MNKTEIKDLLNKYDLRPKKFMGQNFLIEQNIVEKIAKLAEIKKDETVLEIGPGLGGLTQILLKQAKQVIAIEKDENLVKILEKIFQDKTNLKIFNQDILKIDEELLDQNYKIVANLPYYLTAPVIRKFLEIEKQPEIMILLTQKEVAQRICAQPPKMNLLAVSIQYYALSKILGYVSRDCFWPQPRVDSAILQIFPQKKIRNKERDNFFKIVKAGFSAPRKQLINNLSKQLDLSKKEMSQILEKIGMEGKIRPGNLSIQDWENLAKELS